MLRDSFPARFTSRNSILPGLPTHFTRQQHQSGVIAGRELHKNCTHLFWQKQPETFTSQHPKPRQKWKAIKGKARKCCFVQTHFLKMSLGLWDTPASLGRCAYPHLYSNGFQAFPAQKNSAAVTSSWSHHTVQLSRANSSGLDEQALGLPSSLSQVSPPPQHPPSPLEAWSLPISANGEHTQCVRRHLCPYKLSSLATLIICPAFLDRYACSQVILVSKTRVLMSSKGPLVMFTVFAADTASFVELSSHRICPCCSVSRGL